MAFLAVLLALFTFLLIPVFGGLYVQFTWRKFRTRVSDSVHLPEINFGIYRNKSHYLHRFRGRIDAAGANNNNVWVRGRTLTVNLLLEHCRIYVIPDEITAPLTFKDLKVSKLGKYAPREISWKRTKFLQEGCAVYIVGFPEYSEGAMTVKGTRKTPLIMLIHEGSNIIERFLWSARTTLPLWSVLTFRSIFVGSFSILLIFLAEFIQYGSQVSSWFFLILSFAPFLLFLPPGLFFFMVSINHMQKIALYRARVDMLSAVLGMKDSLSDSLWKHPNKDSTDETLVSMRKAIKYSGWIATVNLLISLVINIQLLVLVLMYLN